MKSYDLVFALGSCWLVAKSDVRVRCKCVNVRIRLCEDLCNYAIEVPYIIIEVELPLIFEFHQLHPILSLFFNKNI